jgi:hypothetical protein
MAASGSSSASFTSRCVTSQAMAPMRAPSESAATPLTATSTGCPPARARYSVGASSGSSATTRARWPNQDCHTGNQAATTHADQHAVGQAALRFDLVASVPAPDHHLGLVIGTITCCTSMSGAEAPAVRPTRRALEPGGLQVVGAVDHVGRRAQRSASSRRRLLLLLVGLPTTMTTSTCGAISLTASCRFCVA